jgi:lambda repressor-like predicted transcriptional regulator
MTPEEYKAALDTANKRLAELQARRAELQARKSKPARPRRFPPGAAEKGGAAAAPVLRQLADEHYAHLYDLLAELRSKGMSLAAIAAELNARGEKLRNYTSAKWSPTQVGRVLRRGERLKAEKQAEADAGADKTAP